MVNTFERVGGGGTAVGFGRVPFKQVSVSENSISFQEFSLLDNL